MANGAINYKFMDEKLGLGPGGGTGLAERPWAVGVAYALGDIVTNGGHKFRCSVAGASAAAGVGPTPQYLVDNAATWVYVGPASAICGSDANPLHEVGYIALAKDLGPSDYGVGEFMYVKFTGAAAIKAGDLVTFDRFNKTCVGVPVAGATANGSLPCGIAMANHALDVATPTYGWIMVRGIHDGANVTTGGAAGNTCSCGAAVGRLLATGYVAVKTADGVIARSAGVNNVGTVEVYWPSVSGR
jgi:hypothetical protein